MRRLTRGEWLWYVIFPPAFIIGLVLEEFILGWDFALFINLSPLLAVAAFFPLSAGWWMNNMDKLVSARATNLSVMGIFASVVLEAARYALSIRSGIAYFVFEACIVTGFIPGFIGAFYYLGVEGEADGPLRAKGQKIILGGFLIFIYLGLGSGGVANIASGVFHADFLPQVWLWLGRIGLQAGTSLMGIGVLITRRGWSLTMQKNLEDSKETWGSWLQGLTFILTMVGVFLSSFSLSPLGGLISIIAGLLFYPIGRLVDALSRNSAASNAKS